MKLKKVVLDCERMKYQHTGLYHYCLQLGRALKAITEKEEDLFFYVRKETPEIFGRDANYLQQNQLDKFYMPLRGVDVWHCTYQATNYFPMRKGTKVVFTIHDLNIIHEGRFSAETIKKKLAQIQQKINRADHVIAISEFTLSDVKKHLQIGNKPTSVIYNGCNFEQIENPATPAIPAHAPFLFTIGTINAKKNFHVLPCLLEGNNKQLIIAGITDDEHYKIKIAEEAAKYGVQDRVIFAGAISENDKQWYMKNCEAFVFPSLAEGFGLPVIEAMYFGKPAVLAALTALPEIGGTAAYYFDSFEPAVMQQNYRAALMHFAAHPEKENEIRARAKMFTWENAAREHLNVYKSLY